MTKKIILAAFIAALAFTACHKDPEPQTVTRLASRDFHNSTSVLPLHGYSTYTWDNGNLVWTSDSIVTPVVAMVSYENYYYENGNLVKMEEASGEWEKYYSYENGRLKTFLEMQDGDSVTWGSITAYTEDGLIQEFLAENAFGKKTQWNITWTNGDATEVTQQILAPADVANTVVTPYSYDNKPSVYTGFPVASVILEDNGHKVAQYLSKHNAINEGYTYNYNDKDLLVSVVAENDTTYYNYIEQTVQ